MSQQKLKSPSAALLIIGQELLAGKVRDENVEFLARELFGLGVEVKRVVFVADEEQEIVAGLNWLVPGHDYVFTTGGMGPTHDDVTVAAVAQALGRALVHSPSLERLLGALYGLAEGPERTRLSRIPEDCELYYPPESRFPQLIVGNVFLFPGVPALVVNKFRALAERFRAAPIYSEALELERSELEILAALNDVVKRFPQVRFGSYPSYLEGREKVRLTLDSTDQEGLHLALAELQRSLPV